MRVLVAIHDYLPRHLGGSELHAHQVAVELARRGHRVTAAFTERDLSAPEGDLRFGELDGVETVEMVHNREYADVAESYRQTLATEVFRSVLARANPDVVHFHHLSLWGSGALAAAHEAGARTVVTLHDYFLLCENAVLLREDGEPCDEGPRGRCDRCLARHPVVPAVWRARDGAGKEEDPALLRARAARERFEQHARHLALADAVHCPSRFLAGVFRGAGFLREDQVHVFKYGYPGETREPRASDPNEPLRVGYLGGVYASKGLHVLVDAFRELGDGPWRLLVHGAMDWFPGYAEDLRRRAEGLPVEFRGRVDRSEVDAALVELDVLVVPSLWYENLPITIQEAFRNAVPVVATDLGGMAESVEHEVSGLLFPRGDSAALAAALRRLAEDRALLLSLARGRPRVPGIGEIADRLESLYASARASD